MPARLLLSLPLALTVGCVSGTAVYEQTLPSEEVEDLFCDLERGSFVYSGSSPDDFELRIESWGEGITKARSDARIATNQWGAMSSGTYLDLWGRSPASRAGIDLTLEGPPELNFEVVLIDGVAHLYDTRGSHEITANAIFGRGVVGDLDLVATTDGVELDARPEPGQTITIESWGPVTLALPYGLEVDLEVFTDPDWGAELTDLGFDEVRSEPDYVRAVTGSGAIPIHVIVYGGPFTLWNAEP